MCTYMYLHVGVLLLVFFLGTMCAMHAVTPGPKQVGFYRTSSGTSTGSEEAMECVERWAEDEEVQMDMDVDLGLIIDTVHSTRELLPFSLPSPSSLEGFGIHQQHSDAVSYTVHVHVHVKALVLICLSVCAHVCDLECLMNVHCLLIMCCIYPSYVHYSSNKTCPNTTV